MQVAQALNRQPEHHDAFFIGQGFPARDAVLVGCERHIRDLKTNVSKLGPRGTEKLGGCTDGEIESVDSSIDWRERWSNNGASPLAPMASVAGWPASFGSLLCPTPHHEPILGAARHPGGAASRDYRRWNAGETVLESRLHERSCDDLDLRLRRSDGCRGPAGSNR